MKSKKKHFLEVPISIRYVYRILSYISPNLTTNLAVKLFSTPMKHSVPKRELHMLENATKQNLFITKLDQKIRIYEYGVAKKKALLIHGWSGRGTQLVKIADALIKEGFSTISFDAVAHGFSDGKQTTLHDFIICTKEIEKKYGEFDIVIGHSLGGMCALNAIQKGVKTRRAVVIGSGDVITDIVGTFINKIGLPIDYVTRIEEKFKSMTNYDMNDLSSSIVSKQIQVPILIIHDRNDLEVPVDAAYNIHKNLRNSQLLITENLGHRKILGDACVIRRIIDYIKEENNETRN